jgi:hypothetical protein
MGGGGGTGGTGGIASTGGAGGSPTCVGDEVLCGGSCVNVQADLQNCGTCANACDPNGACVSGTCLWGKLFDIISGFGLGVRIDPVTADVVFAGDVNWGVDFGGGPLMASHDVYVARFTAKGEYLWSQLAGTGAFWRSYADMAIDPAGNVFIAQNFDGTLEYAGTTLVNSNGIGDPDRNAGLVKILPDGTAGWALGCGEAGQTMFRSVTTDGGGDVVVSGAGDCDLGGGIFDGFLQKLDTSGGYVWGLEPASGGLVTAGPANDLWMAGGELVKLDDTGNVLWTTPSHAQVLAVDAAGNAFVAGWFTGAIDLGGGPLPNAGGEDIYIAKYSPTGAHLWSKSFGDAFTNQWVMGLAVDGSGNVAMVGTHLGTIDFGGGPTAPGGYIVELDPSGAHVRSRSLGPGVYAGSVAFDAQGHPVITGSVDASTSIDFGWGPVMATNSKKLFVARVE